MLILFDHQENPIGRLTSRSLISCVQTEPLNGLVTLDFTVDYESLDAMDDVFYVAHKDAVNANAIQMYKIITSAPDNQGMTYQALHIVHDDMKGYGYIRERALGGVQAGAALSVALEGSRWQVGRADPTAAGSVHFYDNSRQECITKILDTWDVELGYRIVFTGNRITSRYIDLYARRGVETGRRYAYGRGALEVVREESQAGLYTAAIGRGKGEQKFDDDGEATGGYGRRINFSDVVWSKAAGDPVDKPAGQEYVEIPEMTAQFGYSDGSPRVKVCVYQDIEDPATLLQKTYEELLVNSRPLVQFRATITEAGNLELGDTVSIIRKELGIYYKTRVFSVKRDLLGGSLVEINLGDNLEVSQADYNRSLRKEIAAVENDISGAMESAVSWMQQTLTASMFDDDAYYYRMEMGNNYQLPAGLYTFDRPIDQSPTKALYFGAGKLAVSNKKDSQGRWIWSTWATGDGMVADVITSGTMLANLIKAGILSDAAGRNFIDMETGAFNFGDKITYDPTTGQFLIDGTLLVSMISGQTGKLPGKNITLDGNTTVLGTFSVPGSSLFGTIDAQTIRIKNQDLSEFVRGFLNTPTFSTGFTSYQPATMKGTSVAFGANSQYIQMRDTGGRAQMILDGTIAAKGTGYYHEMNAGGYHSGLSQSSTRRLIGNTGTWTVIGGGLGGTAIQISGDTVQSNYDVDLTRGLTFGGYTITRGSDGNLKWN